MSKIFELVLGWECCSGSSRRSVEQHRSRLGTPEDASSLTRPLALGHPTRFDQEQGHGHEQLGLRALPRLLLRSHVRVPLRAKLPFCGRIFRRILSKNRPERIDLSASGRFLDKKKPEKSRRKQDHMKASAK